MKRAIVMGLRALVYPVQEHVGEATGLGGVSSGGQFAGSLMSGTKGRV